MKQNGICMGQWMACNSEEQVLRYNSRMRDGSQRRDKLDLVPRQLVATIAASSYRGSISRRFQSTRSPTNRKSIQIRHSMCGLLTQFNLTLTRLEWAWMRWLAQAIAKYETDRLSMRTTFNWLQNRAVSSRIQLHNSGTKLMISTEVEHCWRQTGAHVKQQEHSFRQVVTLTFM